MTVVIRDSELLSILASASGVVDLRDASGNFIGTFAPANGNVPPAAGGSPFSDEEIERRRQQPDGRPLADILRDLERRG
jgi:hypothetical protein